MITDRHTRAIRFHRELCKGNRESPEHYKACAETQSEKIIDLTIFGVGVVILVFCTIQGIIHWSDG